MITHLLKLVWHRKRANALVMAEIFLSFLIVFAVVTLAVSLWSRWSSPLGFNWQNVWMVEIDSVLKEEHSSSRTGAAYAIPQADFDDAIGMAHAAEHVINEVKTYPEVEAVAADSMTPYSNSGWTTSLTVDNRRVLVTSDQTSDDFARVMRIPILKGRWFSAEDDAQNYVPIVVDTVAAREMFGDKDALGQKFSAENFVDDGNKTKREFRVIGVIPPFRKDGEFSGSDDKQVFLRASFTHPMPPSTPRVLLRLRPGTPASFEADLASRLRRTGGVTFHIVSLAEMRKSSLRMRVVPLGALTLIGLFLLAMVALGLTGVLWQTVTRRMREIGLRRALGATGRGVRTQVLSEVALLSTLSVVAGAVIILQLPILGAFSVVTPAEFMTGFITALVMIYSITLLCGAYPSWLASTIEPADALRYE